MSALLLAVSVLLLQINTGDIPEAPAQSTHKSSSEGLLDPKDGPLSSHMSISGKATYYCVPGISDCHYRYPNGMYAAAGTELQHGKWRGSKVRVCTAARCVTVTLIDTCKCKGSRVIDLYGMAFKKLAPLSRGVLNVTVGPAGKIKPKPKTRPGRSPVVSLPETSSSSPTYGRFWLIPL